MKTYAETQGREVIDWHQFLSKDTYSNTELLIARDKAGSWVTCACGNQCDIIPRDAMGGPLDTELRDLGIVFLKHIKAMDIANKSEEYNMIIHHRNLARQVIMLIEERSRYLIAHELNLKNP